MRSRELKLAVYTAGIYAVFVVWGYTQEKLTSVAYSLDPRPASINSITDTTSGGALSAPNSSSPVHISSIDVTTISGEQAHWDFPAVLNLFMALSAAAMGMLCEQLLPSSSSAEKNEEGKKGNLSEGEKKEENEGHGEVPGAIVVDLDSDIIEEALKADTNNNSNNKGKRSGSRGRKPKAESDINIDSKDSNNSSNDSSISNSDNGATKTRGSSRGRRKSISKGSEVSISTSVSVSSSNIQPTSSDNNDKSNKNSNGDTIHGDHGDAGLQVFWKPALTCALASPLGYYSLKFISFPLMVLAKSSKPVPVMLVGYLYYRIKYSLEKVLSVLLICAGVSMYSLMKDSKHSSPSVATQMGGNLTDFNNSTIAISHDNSSSASSTGNSDILNLTIGISMVLVNLFLDAYTNNEQDLIFEKYKVPSFRMMRYINYWQVVYLAAYLIFSAIYTGISQSEIQASYQLLSRSSELRGDILLFCLCASLGQVLIFEVMKEFGSLAWITISVTRKMITILLSIFKFKHHVNLYQWGGIVSVFAGMGLEVVVKYYEGRKKQQQKGKKEGKQD